MKQRYLITTADERTWPKDTNAPVLFLGKWCCLYDRRSAWEKLDAEVVPYHWDDRKKLYSDYIYIQGLYEEILKSLSAKLNEIHGVDHSVRYWRILVGTWLGYFIQMLFDRWTMIDQAVNNYEIKCARILSTSHDTIIPNDMNHFDSLYIEDLWNEAIYGQLLKDRNVIPIEIVETETILYKSDSKKSKLPYRNRFRQKLSDIASVFLGKFSKDDDIFFISPYLPIKQSFYLQWRLGQFPKNWIMIKTPIVKPDYEQRRWQINQSTGSSFDNIALAMIPKHIPTLYLEGYKNLNYYIKNLKWPKNPKLIFTSNSYSSDDVFKAWAAEKVEAGTPLVIGQHGGHYGIGRWLFIEDHEISISDAWLSWGWADANNLKIKPSVNLKIVHPKQYWDRKGQALLILMTMPRYSYHMYSVPVASQWISYFEDMCRFTLACPEKVRRKLLVRLFKHDFGWCQQQRWLDRFPDVKLDQGVMPISSLIEKSRIYISTYNATTFLESLCLNIPTIMFWNPYHWELRYSAIPYFDNLRKLGIFHETPESAAAKISEVWDDVPGWWYKPEIQSTREYFCNQFSRKVEKPIHFLENLFMKLKT